MAGILDFSSLAAKGGILDTIHQGVGNNQAALMMGGMGMLSGHGMQDGFQNAMAGMGSGMQQDRLNAQMRAQAAEKQKKATLAAAYAKALGRPELAEDYETAASLYVDKHKYRAPTSNLTDDLKEYQIAKSEGFPGTFMDFQQQVKRPNNVINNIPQQVEKTEDVERAKLTAKYLDGVAAEAPKVAGRSADLDFLGRIVSKTNTGPGTDMRATLDGIGNTLGLSPGTLKTQADAIKAVTNRIAPTLREAGSGQQSDAELAGFLSALPNLAASPGGNQLIMATLQRKAKIDRERTQIASQYRAGRLTQMQAAEKLADLDAASIFASPEEKQIIENLMGGQPLAGGKNVQSGWGKIISVEP